MSKKANISLPQVRIIYILTTIFLAALSIYGHLQTNQLIDSYKWVNHTNEVNLSLKIISSAFNDVTSNQRAYMLTGDSTLLSNRDKEVNTINHELNVVDSLTRDNPEQIENLKKLRAAINEKSADLKLEEFKPVQVDPALKQLLTNGFNKSEKIKEQINKMSLTETQLLDVRKQKFTLLAFITPLFIIILFLGALFILWVSYSKINRDLHNSQELQTKVQEAYIALEKKNEELIKGGEQFLKIFDNNPVAMVFAEIGTNHIIYANKLFYKLFGFTAEEVIGRTTDELNIVSQEEKERTQAILFKELQEDRTIDELQALPQEELVELLVNLRDKLFENGFEVIYTRKNGTTFHAIVFYEIIEIGNKKYALASYQDISEIKKVSKELEEKNKTLAKVNKELESVNYISSHDLQEPLRQIQIFASRISDVEQQNLSDAGKIYFEKMKNAARRMQNLIADLLTYSRTKTQIQQFQNISLNQIINQVLEEFAETIEEKQAIIEVAELGEASVIPFQFRQMIYNLIGNALKFSKPDTPPHITIKNEKVKSSQVPGADPKTETEYYHFSISDNGIGFEPQYKDRIFEVFQRLHEKQKIAGTGIGLAIVKNIVENHNGIIKAKGELNMGATFDIYLPANQQD